MFLRSLNLFLMVFCLAFATKALAQSEDSRRAGFYQHKKNQKEYDLEREKGLRDFLKEQADWEDQRKNDMKADKGRKITESPHEGGPEYKADRKEKLQDYEDFEVTRKAYVKEKKSHEAK